MAARAATVSIHDHPFRWILSSALGWAFLTTLVSTVRRRTMKPTMGSMSEQWLLSHEKEFNRVDY